MENIDYKARYEALVKDVRENAIADICNICVGARPPCGGDTCDFECDTCTRGCRCKDCLRDSNWKWRGEEDHE